MHSPTALHESRKLKQARPYGQYVDLLRLDGRLLLPQRQLLYHKILTVSIRVKQNVEILITNDC